MTANHEHQTYLRLSIWIPAQLSKNLISYASSDLAGLEAQYLKLQQQIYQWEIAEDVWSGISDSAATQTVRRFLVDGFSPSEPPESRSMIRFAELIELLEELCVQEKWTDCLQVISEDNPFRAKLLLVAKNHLQWIHDIFQSVPGASVMVR